MAKRKHNTRDALGFTRPWQLQTRDQPTMWFKTKGKALAKARSLMRRGLADFGYMTLYNTKTGDYEDLGKSRKLNPSLLAPIEKWVKGPFKAIKFLGNGMIKVIK